MRYLFILALLLTICEAHLPNWIPSTPHIVVIANGEPPAKEILTPYLSDKYTLVAVDGGLNFCAKENLVPELILGDFDSALPSSLEKFCHVLQFETPNQDKTDLEKALEILFAYPIESVTVIGALGKRVDHALTNLYLLLRYKGKLIFETNLERCTCLPSSYTFSCNKGETLSLIPMDGPAQGIYTRGLKWELNNGSLDANFIGISNVALEETISINYTSGDLLLFINRIAQ
ncbi:MAG: thiamine diphosphokinase [Chlamydiales bacterium]